MAGPMLAMVVALLIMKGPKDDDSDDEGDGLKAGMRGAALPVAAPAATSDAY